MALLRRTDLGKVQATLSAGGYSVDLATLAKVKRYNFDSPGIVFDKANFDAWTRLAQGRGTVADKLYIQHEIAEIAELEKYRARTGFDYLGKDVPRLGKEAKEAWAREFTQAYLAAHQHALQVEYDALAAEVSRATNGRVRPSRTLAAVADGSVPGGREEGLQQLEVDGVKLNQHRGLRIWKERAAAVTEIGAGAGERLGFSPDASPSLAELVRRVKSRPLSREARPAPAGDVPPWVAPGSYWRTP
jgi:hypothetical protein